VKNVAQKIKMSTLPELSLCVRTSSSALLVRNCRPAPLWRCWK